MPDRILGTLLKALEAVYKFPSAQKGAPDSFELDLPIQPVHDMSGIGEVASGIVPINDGLWLLINRHTHAGAGTIISTRTPFDDTLTTRPFGFPASVNKQDWAWWIFDTWVASSSGGAFTSAEDYFMHGDACVAINVGGANLQRVLLHYWPADRGGWGLVDADNMKQRNFPFRALTNPDSTASANWYMSSTAAAASNWDFMMLFGMWPRGVVPDLVKFG